MDDKMLAYEIITDSAKMSADAVQHLLQQSYWAANRTADVIQKSMAHSLCFGVLDTKSGTLIGFARAITDFTTMFYLCDVIVEEAYRGKGVGTALLEAVVQDVRLQGKHGVLLTGDAHKFYEKFGFRTETKQAMTKF